MMILNELSKLNAFYVHSSDVAVTTTSASQVLAGKKHREMLNTFSLQIFAELINSNLIPRTKQHIPENVFTSFLITARNMT